MWFHLIAYDFYHWLYLEFCKPISVFIMFWWDMRVLWFEDWISWKGFELIWYYKLCFYDRGFMFDLQTKFCRIFDRNSSVRIKFDFMAWYRSLGIRFQTSLGISMSCGLLKGVSRNWDPFKGIRRLPHVRPPGRGMTILLVSELTIFKRPFEFF